MDHLRTGCTAGRTPMTTWPGGPTGFASGRGQVRRSTRTSTTTAVETRCSTPGGYANCWRLKPEELGHLRLSAAYDWRRIHSATPQRNALTCCDGCAFLSGEGSATDTDVIAHLRCCSWFDAAIFHQIRTDLRPRITRRQRIPSRYRLQEHMDVGDLTGSVTPRRSPPRSRR